MGHAVATLAVDDITITDGACEEHDVIDTLPPPEPTEPAQSPDKPPKDPVSDQSTKTEDPVELGNYLGQG